MGGSGQMARCCPAGGLPLSSAPRQGLVLLLPGFGYGPDKPLFHYARKAALTAGHRVLTVDYGPLRRDKDDLERAVREAFPAALAAASAQLEQALCGGDYSGFYLVSKSFGTLVAGELTARWPALGIKNFYLTPVPGTLPYLGRGDGLAATGTADRFVTAADRARMQAVMGARLLVFEGADHSLEVPGDPLAGISVLEQVTAALCGMLGRR